MKRILFDLTPTQPTTKVAFHGGSEYTKAVLKYVMENRTNQELSFFYDDSRPLDPEITKLLDSPGCLLISGNPQQDLQAILNKSAYDLFYSALFLNVYMNLDFKSTLFLLTIHGLRGLEMPFDITERHYMNLLTEYLRHYYRFLCKSYDARRKQNIYAKISHHADHIITPSYHTKFALLASIPGLHESKVSVLFSPRKLNPKPEDGFAESLGAINGNYMLLISTNRWLKNAYRAAQAIDELYSVGARIPSKTLLLGATSMHPFRFLKNKDRFIIYGYASDAQLEDCYRNANLFIYPTLNEGFGYPPLEAMKYGTPVITSAISSVPEICGDAVLYFSPFSEMEIKTRILQCFRQPLLIESLQLKGPLRAAHIGKQQDNMLHELTERILL